MERVGARIELQIVGPFRMARSTGEDRTPRGRKACAILAMLALAPGNRRSRKWIQDKLWSDRPNEQGAASLRQSLAEIRRTLGPDRDCFQSDNFMLALDRDRIFIDTDKNSDATDGSARVVLDLLEGLDVRDPEFEEWLREQRQRYREHEIVASNGSNVLGGAANADIARTAPLQNQLLLFRQTEDETTESSILADSIVDAIAKTISELGSTEVLDHRIAPPDVAEKGQLSPPTNSLALRSDVAKSNGGQVFRIVLSNVSDNGILWSETIQHNKRRALNISDSNVLRRVNQVVNIAIEQFIQLHANAEADPLSISLCHSGIRHLFRLGKVNFSTADQFFARAFELEPRGIYLAWRAFLRMFMLAERQYSCRQTLDEEAFDYMSRALEMEPHNSFVASLSAHVYMTVKRSYVAAYELAECSIQLNRANPLGWACLGIAKCHLGKSDEGFRHTLLARDIAGSAPYRFQLDGLCCIAGSVAGEFNKAIHLGEASHALSPTFAPPLRYLTALYQHCGQHDLAQKMVRKLQNLEPDFTYEMLAEKSYPTASLHRSDILNSLPTRQI